jgi:isopentenyl-diphosphate Delta-isomerase
MLFAMTERIQQRKHEHLDLVSTGDVESHDGAGWGDVQLLHASLPEIDLDAIECSETFLGRRLRLPLAIAGMTGGTDQATAINAVLARAAERFGIALGVGSQRAALQGDGPAAASYQIARREAPSAFLIANIGAPQLIDQSDGGALNLRQVEAAISMIDADALAVHLNYLQESVQPEGDRRARGCSEAIAALVEALPVPVIAKETGGGMSLAAAQTLKACDVAALDAGGKGGTSFAAVEALRSSAHQDSAQARLGEAFREWGIPTPVSVSEIVQVGLPVIATGGIRSGLDAAKAIALGATLVGVARPLLLCALQGDAAVAEWIRQFELELRTAMFLTGSQALAELRQQRTIVLGKTLEWLRQLSAGDPLPRL